MLTFESSIQGRGPVSKATTKAAAKPAKQPTRKYTGTTLKMLFAFSGNQCAEPACVQPIVQSSDKYSKPAVIGHIAHIYAHSNGGPRSKPNMTQKERDSFENLLLLCPTHHAIVDKQETSYPAALLIDWKNKHEDKYAGKISSSLADVGMAELEIAARALMSSTPSTAQRSMQTIPPADKIVKNQLGVMSETLIRMGGAKADEVEEVIVKSSQLDAGFPERLRNGFVQQYEKHHKNGLRGDQLFQELYSWAGGSSGEVFRAAAGLCILSHLFIICDVFEK